ncbi:Uncharacterised protein [Yersinia bercovieri]|nr:Uncharacterised protein [Yersinia bercovieri]CNI90671.1 Uncharacterised protein [Yersinia bercovieri]
MKTILITKSIKSTFAHSLTEIVKILYSFYEWHGPILAISLAQPKRAFLAQIWYYY